MSEPPVTLRPAAELAALPAVELAAALRPLWEESTWLAGRLCGRRFVSWSELIDRAEAEIAAADEPSRAGLLSSHPRLGANRADLRRRSPTSWREQGGDTEPHAGTARHMQELNDEYEARFGFPFVEFVAGRPLADLIPVIQARMERDRTTELDAGCAAMVAIARDRLSKLQPSSGAVAPVPGRQEVDPT